MFKGVKARLDAVPEHRARNMNMLFSAIGGLIYLYLLFNLSAFSAPALTAFIVVAALFDMSTVYFVHSGVLSDTLGRIMSDRQAGYFMKLHLRPALIGYAALFTFVVSLYVNPFPPLYYVFVAGWAITFVSGSYAYMKLR